MIRTLILGAIAAVAFTQLAGIVADQSSEPRAGTAKVQIAKSAESRTPPAAVTRPGRTILEADRSGHYITRGEINGKAVTVMVDTGASILALTHEDARRLGIRPTRGDYEVPVQTANGRIMAARVLLRSVRIGNVRKTHIGALIMPRRALRTSLLGMNFLKTLTRFEVADNKLILEN